MSPKINASKIRFFIILVCLIFSHQTFSNTIEKCDSLIRSGTKAMYDNDNVKSLEQLTQGYLMAKKNRWHKQTFYALNNLGINYGRILEYGEAMKYYTDAHTLALKELGPEYEMIVLNNIAILFSKEKKFQQAKEYFEKAYQIAKANQNSKKTGLYGMNLGNLANDMKNYTESRFYFTEALTHFEKDENFYVLSKIGLAECDLNEGKPRQARETAEKLLKTAKDLIFDDIGILLDIIIAKSYVKENNFEKASFYAHKTFERKPNLEKKLVLFELLSEISYKLNQCDEALQYKDSLARTNLRMNEIRDGKLYETSKVKFEIQDYKNQIILKETKLVTERKIFYSILVVVAVIVFFIVWMLRNLSIKHKQKKLIAERNEQILALELEKEKNESLLLEKQLDEQKAIGLLEQERLKSEVELRNRKISAKALYLSGRNQMIEEILQELSQLPQVSKDISLVNHIKTLKAHLKTDNEWENFITHFEEVNQTFLTSLKTKHPNLSANDIRFISYIYMNLNSKEIASMLNISPDSCRKRKERISIKMELPKDTNLYDYLASL